MIFVYSVCVLCFQWANAFSTWKSRMLCILELIKFRTYKTPCLFENRLSVFDFTSIFCCCFFLFHSTQGTSQRNVLHSQDTFIYLITKVNFTKLILRRFVSSYSLVLLILLIWYSFLAIVTNLQWGIEMLSGISFFFFLLLLFYCELSFFSFFFSFDLFTGSCWNDKKSNTFTDKRTDNIYFFH